MYKKLFFKGKIKTKRRRRRKIRIVKIINGRRTLKKIIRRI
jgi:hypothetical protein